MRIPRRAMAAGLALTAVVALGGCALSSGGSGPSAGSGSIQTIDALKGQQIRVGSKEFDEELLLGQIAITALQAAGADAVDKTNITGTNAVRTALTSNDIDLYWEYTGTGWVDILHQTKVVTDPKQLFQDVKQADAKNGITWWAPSTANDTYAIATNASAMQKYHVKTLSQYAQLVKSNPSAASTCLGPEFLSRDDGFPGLEKAYGFSLPSAQQHRVEDAVIYPTLGKGSVCNFGEVASTDGRIPAQHLTPLTDDKHFFPIYNPAITIRSSIAKKYPELEQVFAMIADKLTTNTLVDLNKQVSVDGDDANDVAQSWMKKEGFIS
jgi:osmoprotectant transport system substrate-binding protein